jgi:hypothetical protein
VIFKWPPLPGLNVAPCEANHFLNCLLFNGENYKRRQRIERC